MTQPGDVVIVDFPGVTGTKRRPALVVSTDLYHQNRPDVILGVVTSRLASATAPTDYVLQDWSQAGLHRPSAFRSFLITMPKSDLDTAGRLSDRDWEEVKSRLRLSIDVS